MAADRRHYPGQDAKLQTLKQLLSKDLKGQKVIVFTYYRDTARYPVPGAGWRQRRRLPQGRGDAVDSPHGRRGFASGADQAYTGLCPSVQQPPDLVDSDAEVDILISTDVLSEGQTSRTAESWSTTTCTGTPPAWSRERGASTA